MKAFNRDIRTDNQRVRILLHAAMEARHPARDCEPRSLSAARPVRGFGHLLSPGRIVVDVHVASLIGAVRGRDLLG
jgi:hypothetical protein